MIKEFKEIFCKGKLYWIFVSMVGILCYGFVLTHSSIGIDDELFHFYYEEGALLQQGRWFSVLLNKILNWAEYLPFWREFLGLIFLLVGSTIFVYVFEIASGGKIEGWSSAVFSGVLISYPYISNYFIFSNACTLGQNLVMSGIACLCLQHGIESPRKIRYYVLPLLFLICTAETGIIFVLNGYCIIWFLRCAFVKGQSREEIKRFFCGGFTVGALSVVSYLLNHAIARIIQRLIFGQEYAFYTTSNYIVYDKSGNLLLQLIQLVGAFLTQMVTKATTSTAMFAFFTATMVILVVSGFIAIKEKKPFIMLIGLSVFVSAITVTIVSGDLAIPKRTLWTYSLYVGFASSFLSVLCNRLSFLKGMAGVAICLLIFYQTKESNHLFFADYQRYQADLYTANALAADIMATSEERGTNYNLYDKPRITKPIFIAGIPIPYSVDYCGDEVVGRSIFVSDKVGIQDDELESGIIISFKRIFSFMKMHGYWFEGVESCDPSIVRRQTYDMPIWPAEGSIVEFDDYILVKMGAPTYEYTRIEGTRDEFFLEYNGSRDPVNAYPGIFASDWKIVNGQDCQKATVEICLDHFSNQDGKLSSYGWGIINGVNSAKVTVEIALVGDRNQYIIRSPQVTRSDVTDYFAADNTDYDNCGFSFSGFPISYLEPGKYNVCMLIKYGGQCKTINISETVVEV